MVPGVAWSEGGAWSRGCPIRVRLHPCERDIASGWAYRESNLLFRLISDKDRRKNSLSYLLLISVN